MEKETTISPDLGKKASLKVPSSPREFFAKLYESNGSEIEGKSRKRKQIDTKTEKASIIWGNCEEFGNSSFLKEKVVHNLDDGESSQEQFRHLLPSNQHPLDSSRGELLHNLATEASPNSISWKLLQQFASSQLQLPPALSSFLARRKRRDGRSRRQRTTFSNEQTIALEVDYQRAEYISRSRRCELAQQLSLTETQIKIWYQNRRAKDKRLEKAQVDQQVRCLANSMGLICGPFGGNDNSSSQSQPEDLFPLPIPLMMRTSSTGTPSADQGIFNHNGFSLNLGYLPRLHQLSMLRGGTIATEQSQGGSGCNYRTRPSTVTPSSTQWSPPPYVSSSTVELEELEVDSSPSPINNLNT